MAYYEYKKRIEISVNKHGSKWVVLVGHEDCAGNPGGMDKQIGDIREGLKTLSDLNIKANLVGVWVDLKGEFEIIEERRCVKIG